MVAPDRLPRWRQAEAIHRSRSLCAIGDTELGAACRRHRFDVGNDVWGVDIRGFGVHARFS